MMRHFSSASNRSSASRFLNFEKARAVVRSYGLRSARAWRLWSVRGERPDCIPSHPWIFYAKKGWDGFPDWLGYTRESRPPAKTCTLRSSSMAQIAARNEAKKIFFNRVETNVFEFRSLPFRSSAQLIYRPKDGGDWSPLVLRSMEKLRRTTPSIFFEAPKIRLASGVFVVVRDVRRIFYFPLKDLDQRAPIRGGHGWTPKFRFPVTEAAKCEILDQAQVSCTLQEHRENSALLREEQFGTLFGLPIDVRSHQLAQSAFVFLSDACGMNVERPRPQSLGPISAHFFVNGHPVVVRYCHRHYGGEPRSGRKVDIGLQYASLSHDINCQSLQQAQAKSCSFLLVLLRDDTATASGSCSESNINAESTALAGLFLFPREYLQSSGIIPDDHGCGGGRRWFYVYPPSRRSKRADGRQKQQEQEKFFINSSPGADMQLAVAKTRRLFEEYTRMPSDEVKSGIASRS